MTTPFSQPLTKKQQYSASQTMQAMQNYLEAMNAPDPVQHVINKYGCESVRIAKNKIYQWQHNYGTNLPMIANRVSIIQNEIAASEAKAKENSSEPVKPEIESKTQAINREEKITKKKQESISKTHLENMRAEYEKECLSLDAEIEEHKNAIVRCEKRIEKIQEDVTAIRQVLEIFKQKEGR